MVEFVEVPVPTLPSMQDHGAVMSPGRRIDYSNKIREFASHKFKITG